MKQFVGVASFLIGLLTLTGVAGTVTDFPPDATVSQWVSLFGIAFVGGCLAQAGVWMIKDDS